MALRRLFLIFGILVIIVAQDTLAADEDLKNIMPLHYTIKIEPDTKHDVFYGEYNASFMIYNYTQTITLHSENIFARKVLITQRQPQVPLDSLGKFRSIFTDHITPIMKNYNIKNKTLTLIFENFLLHGNYTLYMTFTGEINKNYKGLFTIPFPNDETNTSWILATNTLFTGGREIFPCLSDLTVKTTFTISVKHNKSEIALSSMPELYSESVDNDMVWTYFETTAPMSSHKITFVIIPNHINSIYSFDDSVVFWNRNVPLPEHLKYLRRRSAIAHKIMLLFKKRFGFKLKVTQIQFIAIPGFQPDPIVTAGFVLHREEDIMFDETFPVTAIVQKNNIRLFLARQLAVQWFLGSSIWSYQWFDAVTEFFGVYALDKIYKTSKIMNWFVLRTVHDSFHLDVDNLMVPIAAQKYSLSNAHVRIPPFVKVSALLRILENILKEEFWSDTKAFLLNESTWSMNFWYCFLNDILLQDCSLKWRWMQTSNYPLIIVRRKDFNQFTIQVDKNTIDNTNYHWFPFSISKIQNSQLYKLAYPNPEDNTNLDETKHEWVPIVNINQIGYCRVNYENEETFFYVSLYENLPVLTRAQYIDDEYHLLLQKKKRPSIWYNITQYLNNELKYEAWYPVIRIFEDMSGFLPFLDDEDVISFKKSMGFAMNRVLRRIAYNIEELGVEDIFQTCLQYEAFKWVCLFEIRTCQVLANEELKDIKDSIAQGRFEQRPGFLREWIYCKILRNITVPDLKEIILNSKLKNDFNDTFINYIPCLGFNTVLSNLKAEDTSYPLFQLLHDSERILLFQSLVAKHVNDHTKELLASFPFIRPRSMEVATALCIVINHIYTPHHLRKILQKTQLRESQIKKHKINFEKLWNKDIVKNIPDSLEDIL